MYKALSILVLVVSILNADINQTNIPDWLRVSLTENNQTSVLKSSNKSQFQINTVSKQKYPELIKMILSTESMDDDERQYWFDILPSMTDSQVDRLFNILDTERKKLEKLEIKYQKEIKQLNKKHLIEWTEFQLKDYIKKHKIKHQVPLWLKDANITTYPYVPLLSRAKIGRFDFITIKELYDSNITYTYDSIDDIKKTLNSRNLPLRDKDTILKYWYDFQSSELSFKQYYEDTNSTENYIDLLELIGNAAIDLKHEPILKSIIEELKDLNKSELYKQSLKKITNLLQLFELQYYREINDYKTYAQLYRDYYKKDQIVIFDLLWLTIGSNIHDSEKESKKTLIELFQFLEENNTLETYISHKSWRYDAEPILLDIIKFYNSQHISTSLSNKIDNFISQVRDNNLSKDTYYINLNNNFFNNSLDPSICVNTKDDQSKLKSSFREDGCQIETLTYKAFLLMKSETNKKANYDHAKQLLASAKKIGVSEYSNANDYIEKEIILFLDNEIDKFYQSELSFQTQLKYFLKKIMKYFYEYTGISITIISSIILTILFSIVIFFPASKVARIKLIHELIFSKANIILPLFKKLIINKLIRFYNKKRFPAINFLPYALQLDKNEFLKNYTSFNFYDTSETVDKQIRSCIQNKDKILLWGEGGFGKTLTAYKVICNIDNFIPIWINAGQISNYDTSHLSTIYSNDNYVISMLEQFGCTRYIFVLDNLQKDFELNVFLNNIKANYREAKVIITSRNNFAEIDSFEFNKNKIDFDKFLQNIHDIKIEYFQSFIDKIKNPLLISIILNTSIDISALNTNEKQKIEKYILSSYIMKQLSVLCKNNGFNKIPNTDCTIFLTYILSKLAVLDKKSMNDAMTVFTNIEDELFKVALQGLEKSLHNRLNIIDYLAKTSLIYKKDNFIFFAHDLIMEYLADIEKEKSNKT